MHIDQSKGGSVNMGQANVGLQAIQYIKRNHNLSSTGAPLSLDVPLGMLVAIAMCVAGNT